MPKSQTTIDPIEAARQISDKASSEIADLQAQLVPLQQKVVDLQTEEEHLTHAIAERKATLDSTTHALQMAQTAHTDAVNYASVASGTVGEMEAIKAAVARKNELDATQKQHDQQVQEHTVADERDQARLTAIRSDHEETMKALHAIHERMQVVESVKQRSLSELGERLNASLMKEYQAHRTHTEEARAALVAAQMDEQAFLAQAAEQMKQWPEHRTFKDALGVDSSLIRILQAELAYIDQIIADSADVARLANSGRNFLPTGINPWAWREVFQITAQELEYAGFGAAQMIETMKQRRERVASFLEQCKQTIQ